MTQLIYRDGVSMGPVKRESKVNTQQDKQRQPPPAPFIHLEDSPWLRGEPTSRKALGRNRWWPTRDEVEELIS